MTGRGRIVYGVRTMYDTTTPDSIPAGAQLVAGYVDGHWQTVSRLRSRFPRARVVRITVTGATLDADVADIEKGDLSPGSGAAWARRKVAAGQHPTLYMNAATWPAVKSAVHVAGLDGKVSYWVAQWDDHAVIPPGAVAKQYIDHGPHGENIDLSVAVDYWPGVDPAPKPPGAPVFVYRRPLRIGMIGSDVTALKRRLKWLGYGGTVPGPYFGRGLRTAVRTFQRAHELDRDGVVGPITARAINVRH
jgi:peptidoglycan hydrolase-like protein with peptidoglycan-binding domain